MHLETRLWSPLVWTEEALMGVDIRDYAKLWPFLKVLPFLMFSFLIINFFNFSYTFTLHHCSAICWDFILRLIRLDMFLVFLFVSVIIVSVYDSDRYGTAATPGKELFMITIYWLQPLLFVIGRFVWYILAVLYTPLFYIFLL